MTKITYWSLTVAIAGFLFGFDSAVISGVDQPLQLLWGSSALYHGLFIMSAGLWGTVVGALGASLPCDKLGRHATLITIGVLYLLSALGCALAKEPEFFSFMRFIGGLAVGVSSIAVPAYISEIAPAEKRGRLVALFQFQLVLGILLAYCSNYLLAGMGENAWRLMLGVEAIPAAVFLFLIRNAPESPRWLLLFNKNALQARSVLEQLEYQNLDSEIRSIVMEQSDKQSTDKLFSGKHSRPISLAVLLAAFNQLSGITFVVFFAPRLFALAGLDQSAALLSSAGIGLTNIVVTIIALALIDVVGRKTLMLIGSLGYIASLSAVAYAFYSGMSGSIVALFIFAFIASHAIGQGAVVWVFIAEIFPNRVRAKGQALGCGVLWILAALTTVSAVWLLETFQPYLIFAAFAGMMVLQLLFTLFMMPETRGKTLEELGSL